MNISYTQDRIEQVAQKILKVAPSKTLCFYGQMGAGKTTLIKAMVHELGAIGTINSPTFGIVNEYHVANGSILGYHFDFYRLRDETEVLDLGFEDYLDQDVWVFIEWPEKIKSFIPENAFNINIDVRDSTTREISF